ncbi:filamentous hemagglutinin N-terminal domain-containing protein, partial [Acidiphilium sp.]
MIDHTGDLHSARRRRLLLASTALSAALVASGPVRANPPALPANTTPQGGQVVGGQASIAQAPGSVTITQSSARTAINWQSFNVGSAAKVTFKQPNAQAIALNRVISNNPSIIAGRIDANGQIVLMNQSGVVFTPGSQVNAESLVVSTAGISAKNFMAGHMVFDAPPKPGARIVNDGTITMKQAGLAAFVAPQVINRGTITATLGHVILAGASTFTLDISGDGLVSIDVTQAVRKVDLGGRVVDALVTNQGLIVANGGTVTLTAQAVDGVIQQLLDVRGVVQADSVGQSKGAITIAGIGGDLQVAGSLLARGAQPGSGGGTIAVDATGAVRVAPTARIDTSGDAGGGVVALGTDAVRAASGPGDKTAPKATSVSIAAGATIAADATQTGTGGSVTLLSAQRTTQNGAISAQGVGRGGVIETSSDGVISLSGTETVFATHGHDGTILLDPATLVIGAGSTAAGTTGVGGVTTIGTDSNTISYVDPGTLDTLSGTIILTASSLLSVASAISLTSTGTVLTLASGGAVSISAAVQVSGSLEIDANGVMNIGAPIIAPGITLLDSGAGSIAIAGNVSASGTLALLAGGTITEAPGAYVSAGTLTSDGGTIGGDVLLTNAPLAIVSFGNQNSIGTIGAFVAAGRLALNDGGASLVLDGPISVGAVTVDAGTISEPVTGSITAATLALSASSSALLEGAANSIASLGPVTSGGSFALSDLGSPLAITGALSAPGASIAAGGLTIGAPVSMSSGLLTGAGPLTLTSTAGIDEISGGSIVAGSLSGSGGSLAADNVLLDGTANAISALAGFTTGGTFALNDAGTPLSVTGALDATSATLTGHGLDLAAPISVSGVLALGSDAGITATGGSIIAGTLTSDGGTITGGDVLLSGPGNDIGTIGSFAATGQFQLDNAGNPLTIAGPFSAASAAIGAGAIAITGSAATTGALTLTSTGGVTESGSGVLNIGALTSGDATITGPVDLGGNNTIGMIGAFTVGNSLVVNDTTPLILTGPVRAAGIDLIEANGLTLAGSLTVGTGHAINLVAGTITDANATLSAPSGTIALAPFTPGTPLDFGGTTAGGLAIAPSFATALAGSGAQDIVLGRVLLPSGTYAADTILTEGTLPSFAATITIDAGNTITNMTDLQAQAMTLAGGSVVNDGTLDATALALTGTGFNGTGVVIAPSLAGSFSQGAVFDNASNAISLITGLTAGSGGLMLLDGATPTIGGTIAVASGAGLTVAANQIALGGGGAFSVPQGTITLALIALPVDMVRDRWHRGSRRRVLR